MDDIIHERDLGKIGDWRAFRQRKPRADSLASKSALRERRLIYICRAAASAIPYRSSEGIPNVRLYLAIALAIAVIFPRMAPATEIRQFDRYDDSDQVQFVSELVRSVKAAAQVDPALLTKVNRFFMKKQPGEAVTGMGRFELNLSLARIADMDTAAKDPRARRIEVEDVMYGTLFNNGIRFTTSFRPTAIDFHTQKPLTPPSTRQDAERALTQTRQWIARTVEPDHQVARGGPADSQSWSGFGDDHRAIAFWAALIVGAGILANHFGVAASAPSSMGSPDPALDPNQILHDAHRSACAVTMDTNCRDPFGNKW